MAETSFSFLCNLGIVLLLCALILWGGWRLLRRETPPPWLRYLLVGAAMLRLGMAVFWGWALPRWGYGNPAEVAGYVMADAYERDTAAWELAQSAQPLTHAFRAYQTVDQYGGLLYLSAAVYRYLGGETHQPLQVAALAAVFSSLAVIFGWGFARRLWGEEVARLTAWIVALYPEAVLLGSSQMREAFTMTLAALAFYGLVLAWQERARWGAALMAGAVLFAVPLSPAFVLLLVAVSAAFVLGSVLQQRKGVAWAYLAALAVLGLAGLVFFGMRLGSAHNPLAALQFWVERTRVWQEILTRQASGWMTKVFAATPLWLHGWIVLGYGVMQPFLPAALIADGSPLWKGVAIWRSLGWTLLLPLLLYAPLRAVLSRRWFEAVLSLAMWGVIVAAVMRAGGDQWDNPRYRVAFLALQAALAAWAWMEQRRSPDPLLRRVLVGGALMLLWFVPWYLRRYLGLDWPVVDVFKTLGLGAVSAFLYVLWDWARLTEPQSSV